MRRRQRAGALAAVVAAVGIPLVADVGSGPAAPTLARSEDPVLLAAGDIARCASSGDEQTASILDAEPGTIAALGDLAYENGTEQEFADCYGPSWGRHKDRTFPVPGNHEYFSPDAAPYYTYFGARAGDRGLGYYSYELGAWHVVALNSNCNAVPGGCGPGSPQETWLRADLAASTAQCTLAYWHHPSFSSGVEHGADSRMRALLDLLQAAHADVLLTASEHHYERFGQQTPDQEPSPVGIRAFVVGTGGALGSYPFRDPPAPNSEVRAEGIRGVLKLTLRPGRYAWQFISVAGETFTDGGETACHDAPVLDSTPPAAPSSLTATSPSAHRVNLAWTAASDNIGVAGYRIFRDGVQVGSTSATGWTDAGLAPLTNYAYYVVAYDEALNVSPASNTATVTTRSADRLLTIDVAADTTIEAATPLTNFGGDATVRVDGSPLKAFLLRFDVTGVGADTVTAAKLRLHVADSSNRGGDFRAAAGNWDERAVNWQNAPAGGTLVGSLGGVTRGNWHELSLAAGAVRGDGLVAFRIDSNSSDGADYTSREGAAGFAPRLVLTVTEASGPDTQPPSAPTGLSATAPTSTSVELVWAGSTDDGRVDGYRIMRDGTQIATTDTTRWTDTAVRPGTAYTYQVVAVDAAKNVSAPSNTAVVTTPPDSTAPSSPSALSAKAVSGTWVDLAWTGSHDDIGVAGYRVLRDGNEMGTTNATSWSDRTTVPDTSYRYEIVAYDEALNVSPRSNAATVRTLPRGTDEALPLRAAFYYPWFPEAWTQSSIFPYTRYTPTLGWYDSAAPAVITHHVAALEYGRFDAAIASWWGRGTRTDNRFDDLLAGTREAGSSLKWTVYHEAEGRENPSPDHLREDLTYLRDRYGTHPSFLRVAGRFVVFVYNVGDGCEVVDRWRAANTVGAYIVLKVFSGHRDCPSQPDAWHQYQPGHDVSPQGADSFSISPGFHNMSEPTPRLARDVERWRQNIREMIASGAGWQLVTTFNEWGEGSAIESAREWESGSGYGAYLDSLHSDGAPAAPTQRTLRFAPTDDAFVTLASPDANNGGAPVLEADASPAKASLLKFDVTGVGADRVVGATLRLHVVNASDSGGEISTAASEWTESTVTWANAPAAGSLLRAVGRVFTGTWYDEPLPDGAVLGDGPVSMRVDSSSTDGVGYASSEGGAGLAPELVLTLAEPIPDAAPPTVPSGLAASALATGGVSLSWTASRDDVGVKGYRILRDGAELATATTTRYIDAATASATRYTYQIVAYDAAGNNSAPSAAAEVTTVDTQPPTTPSNVQASAYSGGIALSWTPSSDDVAVTGYRVVRDGAVVGTTTTTAFTDTTVASATRYSYELIAFDAAGNSSQASAAVTVTALDNQPPVAPTGLTATATGTGRVELAWAASSDDVGVAGYRVLRDGAALATTNATAYTDNSVAPGTSYAYEVTAYDAAGNSSPPSAPVVVATPAATATYTFTPSADASIVSGSTSNLGAAKTLETDASPRKAFLLRYTVSGVGTGSIIDARLRLHVTNSSKRGGDFTLTAGDWNEKSVTWATAPAPGTRVASLAAISSGTWSEVPLAAGAISGDGTVNLRVDSTSSDGAAYASKEAGATLAPQLVLTVSSRPTLGWLAVR